MGPSLPSAPDIVDLTPAQRQSGALVPAASVRHISHRRFLATFLLASVSRSEQDLYRCVSQAPRGAGVSNFAELIVKGQRVRALSRGGVGGGRRPWASPMIYCPHPRLSFCPMNVKDCCSLQVEF